MYTPIGNHYIYDGQSLPLDNFKAIAYDQKIIYEVIRVIDQNPLFLEDHLKRMLNGLSELQAVMINDIRNGILDLIKAHPKLNQNIKIDVFNAHYRIYFLKSNYPKEILYKNGVPVKLAYIQRKNPNVKQLDMDYKKHIEGIKGDAFEVILLNDEGEITEGSKSNFLFIKNDCIISAPLSTILVGVTYTNVLRMATELGYRIDYRIIKKDEIHDMDACFLTGTSLGVLPISKIDNKTYQSATHHVVIALRKAYEQSIRGKK